ncbi:uncharacterized protein LOC141901188 [Tubulanus polymorphus]|uniref:uncharacterized protein LOC141901188 n=1 Tax=Tubulanus polymorphus TaxID=672921 RepID=UPI003DA6BA3E
MTSKAGIVVENTFPSAGLLVTLVYVLGLYELIVYLWSSWDKLPALLGTDTRPMKKRKTYEILSPERLRMHYHGRRRSSQINLDQVWRKIKMATDNNRYRRRYTIVPFSNRSSVFK